MKKYLTVKEVSDKLSIPVCNIYRLRDNGVLPFVKIGVWRVAEDDLQEFIDSHPGEDLLKIRKE